MGHDLAALETVLARFPDRRSTSAGWQVRCPAHKDDHASLSVSRGGDGRVLLHCHAGCTTQDIIAAIGLTMSDLFSASNRPKSNRQTVYDYRDEGGVLLYQVVRLHGKQFRQRRPDGDGGWVWNLRDVRRVVYRLPDLVGHPAVFIVEGEKDAERLWAAALPATTSPHGAGKWREEYAQQLLAAGVRRVAVLPDNDPPGEAHARVVAQSCHDAGILALVVPLPGLPEKGDVSDWLTNHTADELVALVKAAPPFNPSQPVAASFKLELTSLAELLAKPDPQNDWVVTDRIPVGGVCLVAGPPKAGKSTLARALALAVAGGTPWLGWTTRPGAVWYLAFEDKPEELRRHFRRMGATGSEPLSLFVGQAPGDMLTSLQARAIQEHPVLIVVDTLQRVLKARDFSDYAEVTLRFEPLLKLARDTGTALVLLTHASTHQKRHGLDAVLGSTALSGSVDQVFVLARTDDRRVLSSIQRIGPDLEPIVLTLEERTGHIRQAGLERDARGRDIAGRILEALRTAGSEATTESWIRARVEGRGLEIARELRRLHGIGRLCRSGAGVRNAPYVYGIGDSRSHEGAVTSTEGGGARSRVTAVDKSLPFDPDDSRSLDPVQVVRSGYGLLNQVAGSGAGIGSIGGNCPTNPADQPQAQSPPSESVVSTPDEAAPPSTGGGVSVIRSDVPPRGGYVEF